MDIGMKKGNPNDILQENIKKTVEVDVKSPKVDTSVTSSNHGSVFDDPEMLDKIYGHL